MKSYEGYHTWCYVILCNGTHMTVYYIHNHNPKVEWQRNLIDNALTLCVICNKQLLLGIGQIQTTPLTCIKGGSQHIVHKFQGSSSISSGEIGNKPIKTIFWPLTPDDITSIHFLFWIWIALIKMYIHVHIQFHWAVTCSTWAYKQKCLQNISLQNGCHMKPSCIT